MSDLLWPLIRAGLFRFDPETTEIIACEQSAVIPVGVIDLNGVLGGSDIDIDVFDDHRTEFAADIPGAIARKCRSREHSG